jgi:hypothetical protein
MPDWLSDPPRSLYIVLILAGVLPLAAALFVIGGRKRGRDQKKNKGSPVRLALVIVGVVALLLLLGLKTCDMLYESDREQIQRKLTEMSAGVHEGNLNKVFEHISDSLRVGSTDKAQLRRQADRARQSDDVTEIPIWDVSVEPIQKGDTKAHVRFRFKVNGNLFKQGNQFLCKATFVRDPDGQWRLQSFDVFMPPNERDPISVPGM